MAQGVPDRNAVRVERGRSIDARVRAVAATRHGVLTSGDLRRLGIGRSAVATRVKAGEWERRGRVWIVRAVAIAGDLQTAWVLQASGASDAVVSGTLATRLSGWDLPGTDRILVQGGHTRVDLPGITVIRRSGGEVLGGPGGLRLSPPLEGLVDALACLSADAGERLLDRALQRHFTSVQEFSRVVDGRLGRGCRGAAVLRRLRDDASCGTRSEAERRMAILLKRTKSGTWIANHPLRDGLGDLVAEIDFAEKSLRIAIEVDGRAFHSDRRSFEHDRRRQNLLVLDGWLVLRFTWEQITRDPGGVVACIRAAVAQRKRSLGRVAG